MIAGFDAKLVASADTPLTIGNVPSGMEALLLADMARAGTSVAYVMSDGQRVADLEQILGFVAPDIPVMTLPAWDCLPYDRVSPSADTSARRLAALSGLISHARKPHPAIVLVTVNAMLQKMAPRDIIESLGFSAKPGNQIRMDDIAARLERNGFDRVATVREVGEFAVRGGILDVFVPGTEEPVRLDFFGDTLESIRTFDPASQRTIGQARSLDLNPMSEVTLTPDTISRFRKNYLSLFGAATRDDALYQAVSEGRRYAGMEHWLPLFYEKLETAFDYLEGFRIVTDHTAREAAKERSKLVLDYYDARRSSGETKGSTQGAPYKPVSPGQLYLDGKSFDAALAAVNAVRLTPFNEQDSEGRPVATLDAHVGPRWARPPTEGESEERVNVFDLAVKHIAERRAKGWKVLITGWSEGSLDRLLQVLNEHGLEKIKPVASLKEVEKLGKGEAASAVLSLEAGFETGTLAVIGEQDILGDRMVRRSKRRKRGADFISEVAGWTKARWSSMPSMVSAALSACGQSRQRVRRAPAWNCIMPTMQSCSCRLKTSIFFPVTAPMRRKPRLTSWVAAHGRCARPSSRSACSTWPTSLSASRPRVWCGTRRFWRHPMGFTTSLPPVSPMTRLRTS